jgi:hypothetical protein
MHQNLFVGIGAQKCASTWLYEILQDHPQVVLSTHKETDFFSYHYGRGLQWYERQFPTQRSACLSGEISPSYLISGDVPERLASFAPDAKILVSLRDPVERAISNHRHEVRLGNFTGPDLSFEAGLQNNPMYLEQSRYGTHLRRWLRYFTPSRILIVLQEDIQAEPLAVARQVYGFLGIDAEHISTALHARPNESHLYRSRALEWVRKSARMTVRSLGMDGVWQVAQRAGMQNLYRRLNRRSPETLIPPVSAVTKQRLRRVLEDEIRMVEELTGRSLPTWRADTVPGDPKAGNSASSGQGGQAAQIRSQAKQDGDLGGPFVIGRKRLPLPHFKESS